MKFTFIKVIILIAVDKERPQKNSATHVSHIHLKSLHAKNDRQIHNNTPILIITTGVGKENAVAAAKWIESNTNPLFVINIGSCGSTTLPLGTTISCSKSQPPIPTKLPSISDNDNYIDMESAVYHTRFKSAAIPFYCIKTVTDANNQQLIPDFNRILPTVQTKFKQLLPWIYQKEEINRNNISVIIPTYNRGYCLKRCIDSVINQSISPKEIIIVDDGSTDHTAKILSTYHNNVHLISLKRNNGVSIARNKGIAYSTGKWIMLLDSDDEWLPNKIESQIHYINHHPYFLIVQSLDKWVRNGKTVKQPTHLQKKSGWIFNDSLNRCMISPSSVCFHRSLWDQFGPFKPDYLACEDYDLWLKITRHYPVGLDPTPTLIRYAGHSDQLSSRIPILDRYRVKTLKQLYKKETDPQIRKEINTVRQQKETILINGANKRGIKYPLPR